jgi:hypothetical protein
VPTCNHVANAAAARAVQYTNLDKARFLCHAHILANGRRCHMRAVACRSMPSAYDQGEHSRGTSFQQLQNTSRACNIHTKSSGSDEDHSSDPAGDGSAAPIPSQSTAVGRLSTKSILQREDTKHVSKVA